MPVDIQKNELVFREKDKDFPYLSILSIIQTAFNHSIDNRFQTSIDWLSILDVFKDCNSLLGIEVDALGDNCIDVLVTSVHIEKSSCTESVS